MHMHVRIRFTGPGSTKTHVARRHTSPRQIRDGASAVQLASQPPSTTATTEPTRVIQIQVDTSLLEPRRGSIVQAYRAAQPALLADRETCSANDRDLAALADRLPPKSVMSAQRVHRREDRALRASGTQQQRPSVEVH